MGISAHIAPPSLYIYLAIFSRTNAAPTAILASQVTARWVPLQVLRRAPVFCPYSRPAGLQGSEARAVSEAG